MADERVPTKGTDASRRAVVGGIVGFGIGGPLLAACGSEEPASSASGTSGTSGGTTSTGAIGTKADVPVGGGRIFAADKVVITQPTEGVFKAFSAVCTHRQCVVSKIEGQDIDCTCHGSKFSITDGSVVNGPATKPLAELKVTESGEDLSVS